VARSKFSISASPRPSSAPTKQTARYDRAGRKLSTVGEPGRYLRLSFSPDETQVAVDCYNLEARAFDIWLIELLRGVSSRFTFDPAYD
jgi:hypothetical protein